MNVRLGIGLALIATGCGDNLEPLRGGTPDQRDSGVAVCNPLTQQGCLPGEKCAGLGDFITCVPNGSVPPGGECGVDTEGPDPCRSEPGQGYTCLGGTCNAYCDPADGSVCGDESVCVKFFVTGLPIGVQVGICLPFCDPVAQDCGSDVVGCYLTQGRGTCAPIPPDAVDREQDDECVADPAGNCFANGCDRGYQPLEPSEPMAPNPFLCAKFCTPARTDVDHTDHPEGIEDPANGMTSCASPASADRPGPDSTPNERYQCRHLNTFFSDSGDQPDTLGFCVDKIVWGACEDFDAEGCLLAGGDPEDPTCENLTFGCLSQSDIAEVLSQ